MLNNLLLSSDVADLSQVWDQLSSGWVGPLVLIIMGVCCIKFLFSREWTKFLSFLALGVVVALVIYGGKVFFSKDSKYKDQLQNWAQTAAGGGGGASA